MKIMRLGGAVTVLVMSLAILFIRRTQIPIIGSRLFA